MQIFKIDNTSFSAKLQQTKTLQEAVMSAKNETKTDAKYNFYNALNIIHEDLGLLDFEIKSVAKDAKDTISNKFKLKAKNADGDVFSYTTSIYDKEEEGISAMRAISDFIEKYYGHRTALYTKLSRKFPPEDLNDKIDGILYRNHNRYVK